MRPHRVSGLGQWPNQSTRAGYKSVPLEGTEVFHGILLSRISKQVKSEDGIVDLMKITSGLMG